MPISVRNDCLQCSPVRTRKHREGERLAERRFITFSGLGEQYDIRRWDRRRTGPERLYGELTRLGLRDSEVGLAKTIQTMIGQRTASLPTPTGNFWGAKNVENHV